MAVPTTLSESALALLRLHVARPRGFGVDDANREAYRELARAGLMIAGHSFTGGRESFYAMTELGMRFARVLGREGFREAVGDDAPIEPSRGRSSSPRR